MDIFDTSKRNVFRAIITDIGVGLTFTRIASSKPHGSEARSRNQANGRKAYDTLLAFSEKLCFTTEEQQDVSDGLDSLKAALEQLGECIP